MTLPKRKPGPNRYKRTEKARVRFLETLRRTGNISTSARACAMSLTCAYNWRKTDEEFAKEWDMALEEAIDSLEQEAWRRARDGVDDPVIHKGMMTMHVVTDPLTGEETVQPLTVKKYSDRLMEVLLKAHRPKFRDKVEHSGKVQTGGVLVVRELPSEEEWEERVKKTQGPGGLKED